MKKKCNRPGASGLSAQVIRELEIELSTIERLVNSSHIRLIILDKNERPIYMNESMKIYLQEMEDRGQLSGNGGMLLEESNAMSGAASGGGINAGVLGANTSKDHSFMSKLHDLQVTVASLVGLFPEIRDSTGNRVIHIKSNVTLFSCYQVLKRPNMHKVSNFTLVFFAVYDRDIPLQTFSPDLMGELAFPTQGGQLSSTILQNLDTRIVDEGMDSVLTNLALILGSSILVEESKSIDN